jgi:hypothetical protein
MLLVWVSIQNERTPGVANAMLRDIARIVTPNNVPFIIPDAKPTSGHRVSERAHRKRVAARRIVAG